MPNYFNNTMNMFDVNDDYDLSLNIIDDFLHHRTILTRSSFTINSNRSIIIEFLFHFVHQLYQTFHRQRSQFHLNEHVLVDLHRQVSQILSNTTNTNHLTVIPSLLNHTDLLERIENQLAINFDVNAELVHICLNQIRKSQTSLIFHYTWTIYIQYLHTYYNVLWPI
jgi:hypothetical protein